MRGRIGAVASLLYPLLALLLIKRLGSHLLAPAATALKLYPAAVNIVLLYVFSASLVRPPSFAERMAMIEHPVLPPRAARYAHAVTKVWCIFFILNGSLALATAFWASDGIWALYNGLIAYALMGCLAGAEWLVRHRARLYDPA